MASKSKEKSEAEKKKIYECVSRYLVPQNALNERGYPRMDSSGTVSIRNIDRKTPPMLPNPHERLCYRCRTRFTINPDGTFTPNETCVYHRGGVWKGKHVCCGKNNGSIGCMNAQSHVHRENRHRDLEGFVNTSNNEQTGSSATNDYGVYGVDCEMIYTSHGLELAQVTVVDVNLKPVLKELVKPSHRVVEWNTQFSGITADMMENVTTTLSDVQERLLSIFNDKTILIGHSPEYDFIALKLIHNNVVDTSDVFQDPGNPRHKKSLKELVKDKLHRTIQADKSLGHDSTEDAVACMELILWKVYQDPRFRYL